MPERHQLVRAAITARQSAYAPYSRFLVGAALETADGRVFAGCNVENASYGLTMCAERVAIGAALAAGAREFKRIAIATDAADPTPPCGACLQVLWEFTRDLEVILANLGGERVVFNIRELLPHAFDVDNLPFSGGEDSE
jgi:cytidine deaminase